MADYITGDQLAHQTTEPERVEEGERGASEGGLNVYQRFSLACRIIDSQEWVKDQSNAQYKSIPIDAMRAGVRKACIKAGLIHLGPVDLDYSYEKDDRTFRWRGSCHFVYVNADRPDERITFESIGEAMDNGDKGAGKLISNLIKSHYKAAFDIGEQGKDDVDSYSNEEVYAEADRIAGKAKAAKPRRTAAQNRMLDSLTAWMTEPDEDVLAVVMPRVNAAGAPLDDLPAEDLEAIFRECSKIRREKAAKQEVA